MAKGRKLTTSRSEIFLGSFGYNQDQGTVNGSFEIGEDEVWSVIHDSTDSGDRSTNEEWTTRATAESNIRPPPRAAGHQYCHAGGLSFAFDGSRDTPAPRTAHQFREQESEYPRGRQVATSAPVNVPDWSKIYRVNSVESLHEWDVDFSDPKFIPPHEYLARECASSRNSVFEGVGRTLKGRDMSRVRDAVWNRTGFDG